MLYTGNNNITNKTLLSSLNGIVVTVSNTTWILFSYRNSQSVYLKHSGINNYSKFAKGCLLSLLYINIEDRKFWQFESHQSILHSLPRLMQLIHEYGKPPHWHRSFHKHRSCVHPCDWPICNNKDNTSLRVTTSLTFWQGQLSVMYSSNKGSSVRCIVLSNGPR